MILETGINSGEDHQHALIKNGFIESLYELLKHPDPNIRLHACCVVRELLQVSGITNLAIIAFQDGQIFKDLVTMYLTDVPKVSIFFHQQ